MANARVLSLMTATSGDDDGDGDGDGDVDANSELPLLIIFFAFLQPSANNLAATTLVMQCSSTKRCSRAHVTRSMECVMIRVQAM
jgi:hypothetical protein